jgi:hypothetical protein
MPAESEYRALTDHLEWIGYVQPVGLVVSPAALLDCQAYVDRNIHQLQQALLNCLSDDSPRRVIDFARFTECVLEWRDTDLQTVDPGNTAQQQLCVALPEYGQTLQPTFAVPDPHPDASAPPWLMLITNLKAGTDFDQPSAASLWNAAPQVQFERLLRETNIPIGLLFNGDALRLVYCPRGENSGHITFPFEAMATVAGRTMLSALHMLLSAARLFTLPPEQRLPALLAHSRKAQSRVSEQLAGQVLGALYELLRGFQSANATHTPLQHLLSTNGQKIYKGILTVLLRLIFLLYAEDRGLISASALYSNHYSVAGLFDHLRADAAIYPDTMEQRYGAWARLLVLFRLIHGGVHHPELSIPAREGYLFDPDQFPFLEGRSDNQTHDPSIPTDLPRISDHTVYRVLEKLMLLDGQRLSYRTLDVEQIGSVYETMIGFELIVADNPSIILRPTGTHGAPTVLNLAATLTMEPSRRAAWIKEQTGHDLTGQAAQSINAAATVDQLLEALQKKIARDITPAPVPAGTMLLNPTDERRRSGSHYTPRALTEPIVRKALAPVLAALGLKPTPEDILELKICDPAMGSGAFLVEACRQLADELVKAWHTHNRPPVIPPDEDEILHARRIIAQRCIYGVDRNPMAVDLARLSLWLATLAKNHPFTFLDHVLRCGDSLVGLTRRQITDGHWLPTNQRIFGQEHIESCLQQAIALRKEILAAGDHVPHPIKSAKLTEADQTTNGVRFFGDVITAAFFSAENGRKRQAARDEYINRLAAYLRSGDMSLRPGDVVATLRTGANPVFPFHWEAEFPEVFDRENGGFDVIVGNPPFAGKNTLIAGNRRFYPDFLAAIHEQSNGNTDLSAHFFRRAFVLLRLGGTMGLIATNTIAQGDTRSTGLRYICTHGGSIYCARRRYKWPGQAAVVVSIVHIFKRGPNMPPPPSELDGRTVKQITAFLFHAGGHDDPHRLLANAGISFVGSYVLGMGFTFDDTDPKGIASSIAQMHRLIAKDPRNAQRIFPYIGGEEICTSPTHAHHRYAIDFGEMSLDQAAAWPDLLAIVEERVKPERANNPIPARRDRWWQHAGKCPELYSTITGLGRVLAITRVTQHLAPTFLPTNMVYADSTVIIALEQFSALAVLQSRIHEIWARVLASSMKDDMRYTPTDCFETFPFPANFLADADLESTGKTYYEFRAQLLIRNNQGLTETYNRFHNPAESSADIITLRQLHQQLDSAVLKAYGWADIQPVCQFILDYEDQPQTEPDAGRTSKRKKPWRYRWPDETRDEILARLLELNHQRTTHEPAGPLAAPMPTTPPTTVPRSGKRKPLTAAPNLFTQASQPNPNTSKITPSGKGSRPT